MVAPTCSMCRRAPLLGGGLGKLKISWSKSFYQEIGARYCDQIDRGCEGCGGGTFPSWCGRFAD